MYLFEAPIDMLRSATIANSIIGKEDAWTAHSQICLAGTSDADPEHYFKSHSEGEEIRFVLDNDKAEREAVRMILISIVIRKK
nr:toprim domain-containing protein [Ruminococcus sp.]